MHSSIVCKKVKIKNVGEYHDLYLKRDALLLPDNFKNFKEMCLKSWNLDSRKILSAPELAEQAAFKKIEVKLKLLIDINMLPNSLICKSW